MVNVCVHCKVLINDDSKLMDTMVLDGVMSSQLLDILALTRLTEKSTKEQLSSNSYTDVDYTNKSFRYNVTLTLTL